MHTFARMVNEQPLDFSHYMHIEKAAAQVFTLLKEVKQNGDTIQLHKTGADGSRKAVLH